VLWSVSHGLIDEPRGCFHFRASHLLAKRRRNWQMDLMAIPTEWGRSARALQVQMHQAQSYNGSKIRALRTLWLP